MTSDPVPKRRVVCAATRFPCGLIVCGARHCDSAMRLQLEAIGRKYSPADEGFIDQNGVFLTRREAWKVAFAAGQIVRRVGGDGEELYSENLY
jgi:hypothetical protein